MKTHEDLRVILKNLKKPQLNGGIYKSYWIEDPKDHIYPKRRPLEKFELIDAQIAKENKKIYSEQKVLTRVLEVSTYEDNVQEIDKKC